MQGLIRDGRQALRLLGKAPGFSALAVLVLALGIGANTAIFSLVNAFLLRPLPGSDSGVLYGLYSRDEKKADDWRAFSWPNYVDIRDGNEVFASLLAHNLTMAGVREGDATRRFMAGLVSANYFEALGVRVRERRAFLAAEAEAGADVPVAIVSHGYAQRRSLGLGQSVSVNGRALRSERGRPRHLHRSPRPPRPRHPAGLRAARATGHPRRPHDRPSPRVTSLG